MVHMRRGQFLNWQFTRFEGASATIATFQVADFTQNRNMCMTVIVVMQAVDWQ